MAASAATLPTESDALLPSFNSNSEINGSESRRRPAWILWTLWTLFIVAVVAVGGLVEYKLPLREDKHKDESASSAAPASTRSDGATTTTAKKENGCRYTATQFISFTINTLGGLDAHGECAHQPVDPDTGVCYLGNKKNLTSDVHHRMKIVEEVLERLKADAYKEDPDIDPSPSVLKIFMMPEFFWRGPNGAYSTKELLDSDDDANDGLLIQVADRARELVAGSEFEDYLFVFGTVIAAESPNDPERKPWDDQDIKAQEVLYYNFAPVCKGGTGHQHFYTVVKRYISSADFLSRTSLPSLPSPSNANLHLYADLSPILGKTLAKRGTTLVKDNLLEIDGIRIGIEICLDHRIGALWNTLRKNRASQLVDVHLITSAGMSIERGPNPVVPGGVVYLTDGEASSAACMRTDHGRFDSDFVCREKPDGLKHLPHGGPGYSDFIPLAACIDMEKSDLLVGYYSLYQTQGCAYTLKLYGIDTMDEYLYYPPSLEIYPTIDLP